MSTAEMSNKIKSSTCFDNKDLKEANEDEETAHVSVFWFDCIFMVVAIICVIVGLYYATELYNTQSSVCHAESFGLKNDTLLHATEKYDSEHSSYQVEIHQCTLYANVTYWCADADDGYYRLAHLSHTFDLDDRTQFNDFKHIVKRINQRLPFKCWYKRDNLNTVMLYVPAYASSLCVLLLVLMFVCAFSPTRVQSIISHVSS